MPFVMNLLVWIIVFVVAYFLGRKFKRLILKENEFIGVVCSIGIFIIFFMTKYDLFSSDKSRFLNAISYGITYGLAFGIVNRGRRRNN